MIEQQSTHRVNGHSCDTFGRRFGFSLLEILVVIVILGILAGIVFPKYNELSRDARAKSLGANVRKVREMIQIHRNSGEYPLNAEGNPSEVYGEWFRGGEVPSHTWTADVMVIENVNQGNDNYPAVKTFDVDDAGADNAWYNADRGQFIALVPPQSTDEETLLIFNAANATNAESLDQTD